MNDNSGAAFDEYSFSRVKLSRDLLASGDMAQPADGGGQSGCVHLLI
jgi:hypothetical protein